MLANDFMHNVDFKSYKSYIIFEMLPCLVSIYNIFMHNVDFNI